MNGTKPCSLDDKVVIITGAAAGIGRAAAQAFAAEGCRLVLVDIQEQPVRELVAQLDSDGNADHLAIAGDVTDDELLEALVAKVRLHYGRIDILINNAGMVIGGRFQDGDPARLRKLIEVNLYAPLRLSQLVVPTMIEQGSGHILNVFSASALLGLPGFAAYGASKAGLHAFSRILRRELQGTGIDVSVLCPGSTATSMTEGMVSSGKSLGLRPHHPPEVPARAMIDAVRYRRQVVMVSDQPWAQAIVTFLDRLFPSLMNRYWAKQSDDEYYDVASRSK